MTYRNTPDRDTHWSPAKVIFGRNLRDFLHSPQTRYKPQPEWIMLREDREKALAKRAVSNMEKLDRNCRVLHKLAVVTLSWYRTRLATIRPGGTLQVLLSRSRTMTSMSSGWTAPGELRSETGGL